MSTNHNEDFLPSDWSWIAPWTLFMAAFAALLDNHTSPVKTGLIGLLIFGAGWLCWLTWREEERREKQHK